MTDQTHGDDDLILDMQDVSITYMIRASELQAVKGFNLKLRRGESVGLVGESGCGKSTVAMALMRYLGTNARIDTGRILYKGRDLRDLNDEELRQLRGSDIAMVYQEPMAALNPSLTIGEQLMEVPLFHEADCTPEQARDRASEMLAKVKLPDTQRVMKSYPHQVSGGQQQRVVIAMALLSNPSLVVLDEPTTALDVTVEAGIVELIGEISETFGTSMLYISHNLGLILETCQRVYVMYSGEAVEYGLVEDVFDRMRHPYTRGLFDCIPRPAADKNANPIVPIPGRLPLPNERPVGCNFGPRCDHFRAGVCDTAGGIDMTEVADSAGHNVSCARWQEIDWDHYRPDVAVQPGLEAGDEVLEVSDLRKYYEVEAGPFGGLFGGEGTRYVKANEDISFDAQKQQTLAIVGESGCGKSTFARVLMGLETATEGSIRFLGDEIATQEVQDRSTEQIGGMQIVFQNPNDTLNPSRSVGAQIGRVLRKFGKAQNGAEVRSGVAHLLDLVKLPQEFAVRKPRQLSGGQKQRVGIARAFAGDPELVIADEPVSALDVSVQAAITGLLMDIQRNQGTTLIVISHDLAVVRYLADRVVVMYLGQIMEQGTVDQVYAPPYHPYTEALLAAVPMPDTSVEKKRIVLEGNVPSPLNPPKGCPFATRCPRKVGSICDDQRPSLQEGPDGHQIACHIPVEELRSFEPVLHAKKEPEPVHPGE